MFKKMLSAYQNKGINLKNRIVLAPMTRCQADDNQIPTANMFDFYNKRSDCGLLITEATCISPEANAYPNTPGIYTEKQIKAWRDIVASVKEKNAQFFMQIWHSGMMSHSSYRQGQLPLSPSGIKPLKALLPRLRVPYETPKTMIQEDFELIKQQFRQATHNAIHNAGFDGIELHAASGYLLDSFLHHSTNKRTDKYGGNPENMTRFVLEIVEEAIHIAGNSKKIGIRISPVPLPSMECFVESPEDQGVFRYLLEKLNRLDIAYVHAASDNDAIDKGLLSTPVSAFVRSHYQGTLIAGGNYTIQTAASALNDRAFDLIYFGQLLIANPDLLKLIQEENLSALKDFNFSMIDCPP